MVPNLAAFPEIMGQRRCGFPYEPSDVDSLAHAFRLAESIGESRWHEQWDAALAKATDDSADANYLRLMGIYDATPEHDSRTPQCKIL
jgi:hypothetical protein